MSDDMHILDVLMAQAKCDMVRRLREMLNRYENRYSQYCAIELIQAEPLYPHLSSTYPTEHAAACKVIDEYQEYLEIKYGTSSDEDES